MKQYCYKCLQEILPSDEKHYGLHARPCFQMWFQDAFDPFTNDVTLPVFKSLMLKSQPESLSNTVLSSNFQGRYKKYSAELGTKHYILKVQENDYPELPATEYLCNQIAELLKIPIPKHYLISFGDNDNSFISFVVENFMASLNGANLKHIYHYLNKLPDDFNCQAILKVINANSIRKKDINVFIEMCLFDALIGNHDRHGKNFGFIEKHEGKLLAPIYDNPSYVGIEELFLTSDLEPKGKIATTEVENPSMKDYVIEFKKLGFQKIITGFQKRINLKEIFFLINNAFISENRKNALKKLISKRHAELLHE